MNRWRGGVALLIAGGLVAGPSLATTAHATQAQDDYNLTGWLKVTVSASGTVYQKGEVSHMVTPTWCTINAGAVITVNAQPSEEITFAETCTTRLSGGGQEVARFFTTPDPDSDDTTVPSVSPSITRPESPSIHVGIDQNDGTGHVQGVRSLSFPVKEVLTTTLPVSHKVMRQVNPKGVQSMLITIPDDLIGTVSNEDGTSLHFTGRYISPLPRTKDTAGIIGTPGAQPFYINDRRGALDITWYLQPNGAAPQS